MKWLPLLLAALMLGAAPASAQSGASAQPAGERDALVKQCDMDAGAKKLSGAARGSFISECLAKKPAAAEGGTGRPGGQK